MPSIADILDFADQLNVSCITLNNDACTVSRNRNSKCRKCSDCCKAGAITIAGNKVKIDSSLCVNCGVCTTVCPMGALLTTNPRAELVSSDLRNKIDSNTQSVVVCCARAISKESPNLDEVVSVPCLGHLSEVQYLDAIAAGCSDVILIDGDCSSCKLGFASPYIDAAISNCSAFLDVACSDAIITRASTFPKYVLSDNANAFRGQSRRGFAKQTADYIATAASNIAAKSVQEQFGQQDSEISKIRQRIANNGKLPTVYPSQNYSLIDDVFSIAGNSNSGRDNNQLAIDGTIDTRHFGNVSIEIDNCSGCGMCVLFCPTNALRHNVELTQENDDLRYLDFMTCDCLQCNMCSDVCLSNCLEVSSIVNFNDVENVEPKHLEISTPKSTNYW